MTPRKPSLKEAAEALVAWWRGGATGTFLPHVQALEAALSREDVVPAPGRDEIRTAILDQVERDALCCSFGVDELADTIFTMIASAPSPLQADREALRLALQQAERRAEPLP